MFPTTGLDALGYAPKRFEAGFADLLTDPPPGTISEESPSGEPPRDSKTDVPVASAPDRLNRGGRALAAAYELRKSNRPVSLQAACALAGVDRKNVRERYPEEVKIIRALSTPDRTARRGVIDRRTGTIDAVDDGDK